MNKFLKETWEFNEFGGTPVNDSYDNLMQALSLIEEEASELKGHLEQYRLSSQIDSGKRKEELKALILDDITDLKVVANGLLYRMGLNRHVVECAEYVVSEANLSKFPETLEDAQESVVQYQSDDRYENVRFEQVSDDRYVIIGNPRGTKNYKILKGNNWEEPQKKLNSLVGVEKKPERIYHQNTIDDLTRHI